MAGIYIHIPFCKQRCTYCAFVSGAPLFCRRKYVEVLKKEIESRLDKWVSVDTVYVGGGTPSMLERGMLKEIFDSLSKACDMRAKEITVECNPDSVDKEFCDEIISAGVNRVSIGLQTANDKLLKCVNRPHDLSSFLRAWESLSPIRNKSVDIMMGLPGQTIEDLASTVDFVTGLNPQHISAYSLTVEDGTVLKESGFVVDEDGEADMYDVMSDILNKKGYRRYEVSNFCLPGYESKHNSSYWDLSDYYGFGVSAHSLVKGIRIANTDDFDKYVGGDFVASKEKCDFAEEYIMLSLRTAAGLSISRLFDFGFDILNERKEQIERLVLSDLIYIDGDRIKLSDKAFYVMNDIITDLM